MTFGVGVWQYARQPLVTGSEFVKLIARDGDEATTRSKYSLMRTRTREDDDMESATSGEFRHFIRHRADIKNVDVVGASNHVVVAKFHHDLWRRSALFS